MSFEEVLHALAALISPPQPDEHPSSYRLKTARSIMDSELWLRLVLRAALPSLAANDYEG